jgi:hypothetical protein
MKNVEKNKEIEIPMLLDEKSTAKLLNISYGKLRKNIRPQNKISYMRIGTSIKYTLSDIESYLLRCRVEAKN